jgi:hypothetical protein
MSFTREQKVKVGVQQPAPAVNEIPQAAPLATTNTTKIGRYNVRRVLAGSKLERAAFWIIAVAALVVILLLLGVILSPVIGGLITGAYMAIFVGGLTLLNTPRPSVWANKFMGRKVFPVLRAPESEILRLAGVNAALTFVFAFFFHVIATVLNSTLLAGLIVFGGLIVAGVFYNRARKVIINP